MSKQKPENLLMALVAGVARRVEQIVNEGELLEELQGEIMGWPSESQTRGSQRKRQKTEEEHVDCGKAVRADFAAATRLFCFFTKRRPGWQLPAPSSGAGVPMRNKRARLASAPTDIRECAHGHTQVRPRTYARPRERKLAHASEDTHAHPTPGRDR